MEEKIANIEVLLRQITSNRQRASVVRKKSEIYIEEGADSSVNSSAGRKFK